MMEPRIQIIILPLSSIPKGSKLSMSDTIKSMMKDVDEKKIQKFDEIMLNFAENMPFFAKSPVFGMKIPISCPLFSRVRRGVNGYLRGPWRRDRDVQRGSRRDRWLRKRRDLGRRRGQGQEHPLCERHHPRRRRSGTPAGGSQVGTR